MGDWKRFTEDSPLAERIRVPTCVVVYRFDATPAMLAAVHANRALAPEGVEICELEAGGRVVARGKMVKRRGGWFLKIAEIAEEGI